MYVDNAESTADKWEKVLSGVTVKQDPWHLEQRLLRAVNPKHPAFELFRCAVAQAVFCLCEEDKQRVGDMLGTPGVSAKARMAAWKQCRKYNPEGEKIWVKLCKVYKDL